MLAAPDKEHLPAHSRDVCPWTGTCPVHARPTFADEVRATSRRIHRAKVAATKPRRTYKVRALTPCALCGGPRLEKNLSAYVRGFGHAVPVCGTCKPHTSKDHVPRWLSRAYRESVEVPA